MRSTRQWPERKMVKSTEGLVREAEIELSFQLPLGFTSSVPRDCPLTQSWFIFSEFCGVTLTWEEFMTSLSVNEQNNFGREVCGNLCCHYVALTCAAHERPRVFSLTPSMGTGFITKLSEFKEGIEQIENLTLLRSKYLQTWPGHSFLSVQAISDLYVFIWAITKTGNTRESQTHFTYGSFCLFFWREGGEELRGVNT